VEWVARSFAGHQLELHIAQRGHPIMTPAKLVVVADHQLAGGGVIYFPQAHDLGLGAGYLERAS